MDNMQFLQLFALEKSEGESLPVREHVYRALSAVASSKDDAREFRRLADELRAIQQASAQLLLNFRQNP